MHDLELINQWVGSIKKSHLSIDEYYESFLRLNFHNKMDLSKDDVRVIALLISLNDLRAIEQRNDDEFFDTCLDTAASLDDGSNVKWNQIARMISDSDSFEEYTKKRISPHIDTCIVKPNLRPVLESYLIVLRKFFDDYDANPNGNSSIFNLFVSLISRSKDPSICREFSKMNAYTEVVSRIDETAVHRAIQALIDTNNRFNNYATSCVVKLYALGKSPSLKPAMIQFLKNRIDSCGNSEDGKLELIVCINQYPSELISKEQLKKILYIYGSYVLELYKLFEYLNRHRDTIDTSNAMSVKRSLELISPDEFQELVDYVNKIVESMSETEKMKHKPTNEMEKTTIRTSGFYEYDIDDDHML